MREFGREPYTFLSKTVMYHSMQVMENVIEAHGKVMEFFFEKQVGTLILSSSNHRFSMPNTTQRARKSFVPQSIALINKIN